MRQWHLIIDTFTDGPRNMAVDEMLLQGVGEGSMPPVLRFYGWEPMCLSLGYGQTSADVDAARVRKRGWDIVRRITGGKAILHGDELTYSLILPLDHPLAVGGIVESYRRISQALLLGLSKLGLQTMADRKSEDIKATGPVCFEVPSHYEIVVADGRKLIGSAQVRRKTALMQHGTLPLHGDISRIVDALIFDNDYEREEARGQVRARAITLEDALGRQISWEDTVDGMQQGFAETFNVDWLQADICNEKVVYQLLSTRYANSEWTFRR